MKPNKINKKFVYLISPNKIDNEEFYASLALVLSSKKVSFFQLRLKKESKIRIDKTILKRWGKPEDVLGIIEYLISNKSSYVTGQDFKIDGGYTAKGL